MHVYIHVYIVGYVCMHACDSHVGYVHMLFKYVYIWTHMWGIHAHVCTCRYIYMCVSSYVMCVYKHVWLFMHMYMHMCMCVRVCTVCSHVVYASVCGVHPCLYTYI